MQLEWRVSTFKISTKREFSKHIIIDNGQHNYTYTKDKDRTKHKRQKQKTHRHKKDYTNKGTLRRLSRKMYNQYLRKSDRKIVRFSVTKRLI